MKIPPDVNNILYKMLENSVKLLNILLSEGIVIFLRNIISGINHRKIHWYLASEWGDQKFDIWQLVEFISCCGIFTVMTTFSEYFWITANIGSLKIKKIMLEKEERY